MDNPLKGGDQLNFKRFLKIFPVLTLCLVLASTFLLKANQTQNKLLVPPEFEDKVQLLSGMPMLMTAQSLGITEIAGKNISVPSSPPGKAKAKKLKDVGIGIGDTSENEPTIVANPKDKKKLS